MAFGLGAYGIWGFFPLFFRQLGHVSPVDLLCNRAAWGCLFVSLILTVRHHWPATLAAARRPGTVLRLGLAALLVGANWLAFLWAVDQRQVVASSLGYFLTPLVNVLLGMLVLKERLNGKEWASVGLAVAAVGSELLTLGSLPWISLFIGGSFGLYGLVRKQVAVDAVSGLWLETLTLLPLIGVYALWQQAQGHSVFTGHDALTQGLLALAGVLTALPLMLFAAATQRLVHHEDRGGGTWEFKAADRALDEMREVSGDIFFGHLLKKDGIECAVSRDDSEMRDISLISAARHGDAAKRRRHARSCRSDRFVRRRNIRSVGLRGAWLTKGRVCAVDCHGERELTFVREKRK